MTEGEYILVKNLAHLSSALNSIRDISALDEGGITKTDLSQITDKLSMAQTKHHELIEIDDE